jgi:hypothetical protein
MDTDGEGKKFTTFQAYCDMDTDGEGKKIFLF